MLMSKEEPSLGICVGKCGVLEFCQPKSIYELKSCVRVQCILPMLSALVGCLWCGEGNRHKKSQKRKDRALDSWK